VSDLAFSCGGGEGVLRDFYPGGSLENQNVLHPCMQIRVLDYMFSGLYASLLVHACITIAYTPHLGGGGVEGYIVELGPSGMLEALHRKI
jgi:hypothetical protein